ncbi:MAG: hypothetical protein WC749_07640 [Dehalococcoidia bacterium]
MRIRTIVGLILIGIGLYFAWDANSTLDSGLFKLGVMMTPDAPLTSADLKVLNSPAADVSDKLGADTYGELDNYLSAMRVGGIILAISGGLLIVTEARRHH